MYPSILAGVGHSTLRLWLSSDWAGLGGGGDRVEAKGSSTAFLFLLCTRTLFEPVCPCPEGEDLGRSY